MVYQKDPSERHGIRYRPDRDRWVVWWVDPVTQQRREKTCATEPEAMRALAEVLEGVERPPVPTTTVAEVLDAERAHRQRAVWTSPNSSANWDDDRRVLERDVAWILRLPVADVAAIQVRRMDDDLIDLGRSVRARRRSRRMISAACRRATVDGIMQGDPTIALPDVRDTTGGARARRRMLTRREALTIADVIRTGSFASKGARRWTTPRQVATWTVAMTTGPRNAELAPMRWDDVDRDREDGYATWTVKRLKRREGGNRGPWFVAEAAKTEAGFRTIVLPPSALTALDRWRTIQDRFDVQHPDGEIWAGPTGASVNPNQLRKQLRKIVKVAGVDPKGVTPHALRRACASALASEGVSDADVQRVLGQVDRRMLEVYVSAWEDEASVADAAERALGFDEDSDGPE